MQTFQSSIELPVTIQDAFAYHERDGALQRLIPPWENVRIESSDGSIEPGSHVTLQTRVAGVPLRWVAEHRVYDPPHRFEDVALSGPFTSWHHQHLFQAIGQTRSLLTDHVNYQVPLGGMGETLGGAFVLKTLEAMFAYRHRVTYDDLSMMSRYSLPPLKIAITGANGLVGNELVPFLSLLGHQPLRATRHGVDASTTFALPDSTDWNDCDVVVHLAGKSIANKRWSESVKAEIRDSRIGPTRLLCQHLASLPKRPKVLLCASAIGIYGNRGDEILEESSTIGHDFLAGVAQEWEDACEPARQASIRVVHLRFGIVLSPRGGALAKLLTPARLGLAGSMGSGEQWWSWVAMDDVLGAIYHAIASDSIEGPMNVVAPQSMRNREFTATLGKVLSRPTLMSAPASALRLALGEMADALLLASTRVQPGVLQASGYDFRFGNLFDALCHLLGKKPRE